MLYLYTISVQSTMEETDMKLFQKLFVIAAALISVTPAFASDHMEIDWNDNDGPIMAIVNYVVWEINHLWGHLQALALAASTWNWEFFLAANLCADKAVLTSVFCTWYGLLAILATSVMVVVLYKQRRTHKTLAVAA